MMSEGGKLVAEKVYGSNIGMSKDAEMFVLKLDLGSYRRAFHLNRTTAEFFLINTPAMNGTILGLHPTYPDLHPEDWDGNKTAAIQTLRITEGTNDLILEFDLFGGSKACYVLGPTNWKTLIDRFWQYQPLLQPSPQ